MNKSAREMFEELGWREYFKSSVMITYEKIVEVERVVSIFNFSLTRKNSI